MISFYAQRFGIYNAIYLFPGNHILSYFARKRVFLAKKHDVIINTEIDWSLNEMHKFNCAFNRACNFRIDYDSAILYYETEFLINKYDYIKCLK